MIDRDRLDSAASDVMLDFQQEPLGMNVTREDMTNIVSAILSDIAAQGFVIVPREATEEMAELGARKMAFDCWKNDIDDDWPSPDEYAQDKDAQRAWKRTAYTGWSAMIAAAEEQTE